VSRSRAMTATTLGQVAQSEGFLTQAQRMFGFTRRDFFELEDPAERAAAQARF